VGDSQAIRGPVGRIKWLTSAGVAATGDVASANRRLFNLSQPRLQLGQAFHRGIAGSARAHFGQQFADFALTTQQITLQADTLVFPGELSSLQQCASEQAKRR
jgi:hypothetical protein